MEIPAFRRLIFDLHVIKGHLNFAEIFREFQEGHYDTDMWLIERVTKQKLDVYKALSKHIGSKQFTCLDWIVN